MEAQVSNIFLSRWNQQENNPLCSGQPTIAEQSLSIGG